MDGGGAGSQMIGDRIGDGRAAEGGGAGSQIIGVQVAVLGGGAGSQIGGTQQLVTDAPLDSTIIRRMDFCAS